MNLRDLKYLVSVAKEGHFAKAAEKSFVSQPTLSMQIKKLEDELGVTIFERSQKKFLVTPVGKELVKKAEVILREEEAMRVLAKNTTDPYSGELTIGAFPTLAPYFFPEVVKKVGKNFPKLTLLLLEKKTADLVRQLNDGEIDAALLAMPISNKDFESKKIFTEDFLLAVPSDHSLAKKTKVSQKELRGLELMLLEDGHCLRDQALEVCSMLGALEKQTFRATSLETLKQMIIAGSGITLIPEIAAKKEGKISYVRIENSPKRSIGFYFRKSSPKKNLLKELSELF